MSRGNTTTSVSKGWRGLSKLHRAHAHLQIISAVALSAIPKHIPSSSSLLSNGSAVRLPRVGVSLSLILMVNVTATRQIIEKEL